MKKLLALLLCLVMVLGLGTTAFAADAKSNDIVILHTDDVHCGVTDGMGYAGVAAYKAEMQQTHNYVALVDCGDAIQGETIGTLRDVLKPNTVCDVYVFNTPRGELMIPALKRVVRKVDVDAGVMTLDRAALSEVAVWEDEPAERDE